MKKFRSIFICMVESCSVNDEREAKIHKGVKFAKQRFEMINTDRMTRLTFNEIIEMGGTLKTYVTASIDDFSKHPNYDDTNPTQPWTIVLKQGEVSNILIIEGYGEKLDEPIYIEKVFIHVY